MDKKYELIESDIKGLYRIKALKDFGYVKKGDIGGYVENPNNLSHKGNCWVYNNAKICDNAIIYGNAEVWDYAVIDGNARIYGNSQIRDCAVIDGNAQIHGDSEILNYAIIRDNALIYGDSVISGNAFIGGYTEIKTGHNIGYIDEKFKNVLYIQCKASLITVYTDINNVIKCNIGCQKRMTLEGLLKRIEEDGGMTKDREEYVRIMQNAHLLLG
ncbi:MAG: hypothetical protein MR691_15880 [Clostridium sp.]|nr:hypothetical protein [Clostridium sp.]